MSDREPRSDGEVLLLQAIVVSTVSVVVGIPVSRAVLPDMLLSGGAVASAMNLVLYAFVGFLIVVPVATAYRYFRG